MHWNLKLKDVAADNLHFLTFHKSYHKALKTNNFVPFPYKTPDV